MRPEALRSRLISGTISTTGGNLSTLVLGMLTMVIAARQLPQEAFGVYALLLVLVAFLTQVTGLGLDLSIARLMALQETPVEERRLVNTSLLIRGVAMLLASVPATLGISALSSLFGATLPSELVGFVPVLFFLEGARAVMRSTFQGKLLFHSVALAAFISSLSNVVMVVVLLFPLNMGLAGLLYARAISSGMAVGYLLMRNPFPFRLELDRGQMKELLRFGMPLQANDILNFLFTRLDTLVIAALLGPADIAYYEIARKIPDSVAQLYDSFRTVYYPVLSRLIAQRSMEGAARLVNATTRLVAFAALLGALLVLLFGEQLIVLLFSEKYLPSAPIFTVLALALAVSLIGVTLGTALVAAGDSGKPALINIAHTATSLAGNLLLIPIFGILGAAFANLAGTTLTNPMNLLLLKRRISGVEASNYLKPALAFLPCAAMAMAFQPDQLLQKLGLVLAYLLFSGLLGVFTRGDLATLLEEAGSRMRIGSLSARPSGTKT